MTRAYLAFTDTGLALARRLAAVLDCPVTAGTLREGRWQRLK